MFELARILTGPFGQVLTFQIESLLK